ncbi:hypothetical protein ACN27G_10655 [Plantactinospora sp. WMMB334]|uniref:hypothetical protein n=1 Tax=Plantactinospora sp. WMMB334 TaxID=3404119 RepID=UPI003B928C65
MTRPRTDGRAPVTTCPSCDGLGLTLAACTCVEHGDRRLVTDEPAPRRPYRDCRVCRGLGRVGGPCQQCGQRGERRAQLVLTVANLDTGEVSSASVVPGALTPRPASDGGWQLPLSPVVDELAEAVGAATWTSCSAPPARATAVRLPDEWSPELSDGQRLTLESRAIAGHPGESWQVFLGRGAAPPPLTPQRRLDQLCALADLLCLDMVLEARRLRHDDLLWDVRFDLPGAAVPGRLRGTATCPADALGIVTVPYAISGLAARGLAAPARYLVPTADAGSDRARPVRDLAQITRRVVADCTDLRTGEPLPGACAIWRDGHWWHSSLRVAGHADRLVERETGQLVHHRTELLRRGWEPPDPAWLGDAIPSTPCPDCDPAESQRLCPCALANPATDPGCAGCGGTGLSTRVSSCHTCRGSRRSYQALVVTLTDLAGRVVHLTWRAGDAAPVSPVGLDADGTPVVQLPERFRLGGHAAPFGVRPEELTEADGGWPVDPDLRDGYVSGRVEGVEPLTRYLAEAGRGRPGGRLIVLAAPAEAPSLPELVRLAHALGLAVEVSLRDDSLRDDSARDNSARDDPSPARSRPAEADQSRCLSWRVEVTVADPVWTAAGTEYDFPGRPTLAGAIACALDYLPSVLAEAVPDEPARPVPAPCSGMSEPIAAPEPMLRRLGADHPGQWVTVRFAPPGSRTGESRTGESRTGESRTGESRTGESRTGESRTGECRPGE